MSPPAFHVAEHGAVLELELDTPACNYNIFSQSAADELLGIVDSIDTRRTHAVLIRSAKRGSFINGVGLMMAGTARGAEDIVRMTAPVRQAYRALRALPIPSIAAIEGNCYGCGVEFSLHCDYRIADNRYDTHFYMTEIADYLFVPAFGSSQDLPRLIGLPASLDFLLWGQRWSAEEAARHGLIDRCVPSDRFRDGVASFVDDLERRGWPKRQWRPRPLQAADERCLAETRTRIRALPPDYQAVYDECCSLLEHAARRGQADEEDYAMEVAACGRSVVRPVAKSSLSFFFVRQLALHSCQRGVEVPERACVRIDADGTGLDALEGNLQRRRVRGLELLASDEGDAHLRLTSPDRACTDGVGVLLAAAGGRRPQKVPALLYAPLLDAGFDVAEVACEGEPPERARTLVGLLDRAGIKAVISRPTQGFEIDRLIGAFLAPLVAWVLCGGSQRDADATLKQIGFVRGPEQLVQAMPREAISAVVAPWLPPGLEPGDALSELADHPEPGGSADALLLDAVLVSLLGFALDARHARTLAHPSTIDLLAREVIDFPVGRGSLCRLMGPERAWRIVSSGRDLASLVLPDSLEHLQRYARGGPAFYQTRSASQDARAIERA